MPNKENIGSDLQGLALLMKDATLGITDVVEAMHKQIVHPPFLPSTPVQHFITKMAGFAFKNIRRGARFIGNSSDKAFGGLASVLGGIETTEKREAIQSLLNGIIGDHLEKSENPLQIKMKFRLQSKVIALDSESLQKNIEAINGKILLMVHGSCMNDIQWTRNEHNHGTALAKELDKTAIFLHYNSGRHISTNGQEFSALLEELVQHWPVPVEELIIIAHSMGGLVSRSAFHYGQQDQKSWTKHLNKMVFLGTPHHGASMERAGNFIDGILEAIPYAKPFARLGKIRSAGVTDLRYGNLVDEDWKDADRFKIQGDQRKDIPLPAGVACYSIAGVVRKNATSRYSQWLGDKMVSTKSALGQHKKKNKDLHFKKKNTWIANDTSHGDLLSNLEIYSKLKFWLA